MKFVLKMVGSERKCSNRLIFHNGCLIWPYQVQKGLKLNLVHTYMLMGGSAEDKNHNPILHFIHVLNFFIKGCFLCHVFVYKQSWITISAFYRQQAFGEHSSSPSISLFSMLSKFSQQFQHPKNCFKQRQNAPFSVLAFKMFSAVLTLRTSFQIAAECTLHCP